MKKKYDKYSRANGVVYYNQFHIIFCPKYRRKVLKWNVEKDLRNIFYQIAKEKRVRIKALEVMPDHVHIFIYLDPRIPVWKIVQLLKGRSSYLLRKKYCFLRKMKSLWSPSYFCCSIGRRKQLKDISIIKNSRRIKMAKSKKESTPSYILTLKLKIELWQEHILNKRFEISRKMYNAFLGEILKRDRKMKNDKRYKDAIIMNKGSDKNKILKTLRDDYGISEYSLHKFATPMGQHFSDNIDSGVYQKLASRAWNAFNKLTFGDAKKMSFKKYGTMESVEGKSNSGISFKNNQIKWKGLAIPVVVKKNDIYAHLALKDRIKYCRIVKKQIRGKIKWYVQLILEGFPPKKIDKNTGKFKRQIGNGDVGIDIGVQTVAYVADNEAKLLELAPDIDNIEKEKRRMQRTLDRSKRATNPHKFNEDGTIKKGNKDKWIKSKKYIKTSSKYAELNRLIKEKRRQSHEKMANNIISLGDKIKVEDMDFKALMKRAKNTTINEKTGKINRKKRFGKSIGNKSPSMFLSAINRKLKYEGLELIKIDTRKVKASQYNHEFQTYKKKKLSDRWNIIGTDRIQRDLYSAFLIKNVKDDKETIDNDKCRFGFDKFRIIHNQEIERIKNMDKKMLSSMGI